MPRFIATLLLAMVCVASASAQEAGSRILTTPQVPQPEDPASLDTSSAPTTKIGICDRLEGDAHKRCLEQEHEPAAVREPSRDRSAAGIESGPGSTGMGSGAGATASGSGGGPSR